MTTATAIDGRPVSKYVGVVTGEAVLGANVFRDLFAGLMDIVGGRSAGHERSKVKNLISKAKGRTLEALFALTGRALAAVSEEDARGFFEDCGYKTPQGHSS